MRLGAIVGLSFLVTSACFATIDRSRIDAEIDANTVDAGGSALDCGTAFLCDGFERDELVAEPWLSLDADLNGVTMMLSSRRAHTGHKSLEIGIAETRGGFGGGSLRVRGPILSGHTSLRYSVFVEDTFVGRSVNLASLDYAYDGGRSIKLYVALNGSNGKVAFTLVESGVEPEPAYRLVGKKVDLVRGRWVDVAIDIDHTATPTSGTIVYDGVTIVERVALPASVPPTDVTLAFGVTYASAGPPVSFAFDDVRFDVKP